MKEHEIQKQIVEYVRLQGGLIINTDVMGSIRGLSGIARITRARKQKYLGYTNGQPDLIVIIKGMVLFIEVKTASKSSIQSTAQKEFESELLKQGLNYFIVRSLEDIVKLFNSF